MEKIQDQDPSIFDEAEAPKPICCCKVNDDEDEQTRLGSSKPLPTLIKQSMGPICSQVVTSLYGIVDSFWVSKSIGEKGLTAMGAVSILEAVNNAFGLYVSACVASRISYLFGQKRNDECAQVFVDIIRITWILAILVPCFILPITKPLTQWFGAGEEIRNIGLTYMIPLSGLTIFYQLYMVCCGLLQACGLSWIYGICQACSLILNMICLDPLLLLGFKTPIWGASLASIIASTIPMIILMTMIFRGKFDVKPTFGMFCKKFSPETSQALKIGISTLIELLSGNLPDIIIQKYLGDAANAIGQYNEILSVWSILLRIYMFIICICNGLAQGLLPCASFAFGANRLRRLRNLALHALWIGTVWLSLCAVIIIPNAGRIGSIWLKEDRFKYWSDKLLSNCLYTVPIAMIRFVSVTALQATTQVVPATVQSVLTMLIPLPVFSTVMYFTFGHDPVKLVQSFLISDGWDFVICSIFIAVRLKFIFTADKTDSGEIGEEVKEDIKKNIYEEDVLEDIVEVKKLPDSQQLTEQLLNEP